MEQAHKDPNTTNLYPAKTREVGPRLKDLEGVVWGKGVHIWFPTMASFRKILVGVLSYPKEVADNSDHLMHAIEVGGEVA